MKFEQWKKYFLKLKEVIKRNDDLFDDLQRIFGGFDGELFEVNSNYEDLIIDLLLLDNKDLKEDLIYILYSNPEDCKVTDNEGNILYTGDIDSFLNYVKNNYFENE